MIGDVDGGSRGKRVGSNGVNTLVVKIKISAGEVRIFQGFEP